MKHRSGSSVGARGQITIQRAIREQLGIKPKDIAVQRVEDGRLVVEFLRPHEPHLRSLAGVLGTTRKDARDPIDIDEATAAGVAEEWGRQRERLDRVRDDFDVDAIHELAREIRNAVPPGTFDIDHGELLYDREGLPR